MAKVSMDSERSQAGVVGENGWQEKRAALIVDGLSRTLAADDLLKNAVAAAEAAGYTYGAAHPSISGLYLLGDRSVSMLTSTSALIQLTYRRKDSTAFDPDYVDVSGEIVLVQERTNKDFEGNDIVLEWKPDNDRPAQRQNGSVPIWLPSWSLEFSQRVSTNPAQYGKTYVGFTNSDTFQGDGAGYWLCMGLRFRSPDGGEHWDRSLRFARHPDQWQETVYFVAETGRPPANWDAEYNTDKAVKKIQVYGQKAFAALNCPNVMG